MEQTIQLSDHFGYRRLIRFTIPSILMMIFTSIYGVVDGFFVSNFVGKTSFAAVNFIMPFLMITGVMGFMFGTGGSALIAKIMGEGKKEKAQKIFSLLIMATIICGIVIGAISIIFLRPVAVFLGARVTKRELWRRKASGLFWCLREQQKVGKIRNIQNRKCFVQRV